MKIIDSSLIKNSGYINGEWISEGSLGNFDVVNLFKKRTGIEATIGHLKSDFQLGRNILKETQGDGFNLLMTCCAHNLKLWFHTQHFFCLCIKWEQKYFLKQRFLTQY